MSKEIEDRAIALVAESTRPLASAIARQIKRNFRWYYELFYPGLVD